MTPADDDSTTPHMFANIGNTGIQDLPLELIELILENLNSPILDKAIVAPAAADKLGQVALCEFALANKAICAVILPYVWKAPRLFSINMLRKFVACAETMGEGRKFVAPNGRIVVKKLNLEHHWFLRRLNNDILQRIARLDMLRHATLVALPIFSSEPSLFSEDEWQSVAVSENVADIQQALNRGSGIVRHQPVRKETVMQLLSGIGDSLQELTLMEDMTAISSEVFSTLSSFPSLRRFSVGCNSNVDGFAIAQMHLSNLQVLRLGPAMNLDDAALDTLVVHCPLVEEFVLVANNRISTDAWIRMLNGWSRLRKLMNVGCAGWMHDSVVDAVVRHQTPWTYLSFGWLDEDNVPTETPCLLTRNAAKLASLSSLQGLYLRLQTTLTDAVFKEIILNMPYLQNLDLAMCSSLSDASLQAICESCPRVCMMDIESVDVTDKGLAHLIDKELKFTALDVSFTSVSQMGVHALLHAMPLRVFGCDGVELSEGLKTRITQQFGKTYLVYWDWDFQLRSM